MDRIIREARDEHEQRGLVLSEHIMEASYPHPKGMQGCSQLRTRQVGYFLLSNPFSVVVLSCFPFLLT
jgi:hypothetical protein